MEQLNGLDLFSGIGGITLGLGNWARPVAYCEIDPFAQKVLLSRMLTGDIPAAPIWDDVTTLQGADLPKIDIIYGGFPCQDISLAGKKAGLGGARSGLFYEIKRLTQECNPRYVFLENVANIRSNGLDEVLSELTGLGYDCRWCLLSASDVGAPHQRKRWFCLAEKTEVVHANSESQPGLSGGKTPEFIRIGDPDQYCGGSSWWAHEPRVGRMVDGIRDGVDERLRSLGNAVVPQQVNTAFRILSQL